MKLNALLLLLLAGRSGGRAEAYPIHWFNNLKQGSEAAREAGRPIMIDFWADWCQPCKRMDAEVYVDPAVGGAVSRKIVAVRINFDIQKDLARAYNVQTVPHLVFTNSLGTTLIHHRGFINARDLSSLIGALPSDVSEINGFDQSLRKNKNDFEGLLAMGRRLRASGFFEASNVYFERAARHERAEKSPKEWELILREMGLNYLELRDGRMAAKSFERYLRGVPANEHTPLCLWSLAQAYALDGRKAKAEAAAKKLIAEFPNSEESRKTEETLYPAAAKPPG